MSTLIYTLWLLGLLILVLSLFIDLPKAHSWTMLAWSFPAGAAASAAISGKFF